MSQYILSAVVGIMIFFTIAVAPTVFSVLPKEWSSAYVRKFFPKYYLILGFLCLIAALTSTDQMIIYGAYGCSILFAFSLWVLTPRINHAKDNELKKRFGLLHGLSVVINLIQLVVLIYLLIRDFI
jgi:Domain of unknown function (DUF4149)